MKDKTNHVFLADDDADDCILFEDALKEVSTQITLTKANDGKELMDILAETVPPPPDVIFLDLNMPIKNGFECLSEIRATEQLKNIPVVIFSTSCEKEFITKVYNQGADYYICKPDSFNKLKNAISKVLDMNWADHIAQPTREQFLLTF